MRRGDTLPLGSYRRVLLEIWEICLERGAGLMGSWRERMDIDEALS